VSEALVLLHGFAGTHRTWDGVLARLSRAQRYRALAPDLPGHGEHAGAPRPITFAGCVEHVLALAPERFILCGYSLGGRVALHVALAAPARVARLVLVAGTPGIEDPVERAERRAADRALADTLDRDPYEAFVARWCAQPMFARDPPAVDAFARADYLRNSCHPGAIAAVLRGIGTGEMAPLWGRLAELHMPVGVLAGERDIKFHAIARRIARLLPAARAQIVPGGHRLPLESPDAIVRELAQAPFV
jgi:2-succinyl-6-hydroxy-2,4-cyclohexadiene-1-carboxylate synthase